MASALAAITRRLLGKFLIESDTDSLKAKVVKNASWITLGYGAEMALRLVSSVIVSRLLDPSAYGLMSIAMVFIVFAAMLSDLGLRPIVMSHPRGDDPEFLQTVWTVQILRGLILTLVLGGIAWGWYYAQHSAALHLDKGYTDNTLPQLLALLALTLAVTGFSSVNEFRLARDIKQGTVIQLDIAAKILGTVLNIALAFLFRSVWALALSILLQSIARMAFSLMFIPGPAMQFRLNWNDIKGLLVNSRWVALSSALTVLAVSSDKIVIGFFFNISILGVYSIAFFIFEAAQNIVNRYYGNMGISVIRNISTSDIQEYTRKYYLFRLPADFYCAVGGVALALCAPMLVDLLYDKRYEQAGEFLSLLGIGLILYPFSVASNLLFAELKYKLNAVINLMKVLFLAAFVAIGLAQHSISIVVAAVALQRVPEYVLYAVHLRKQVNIRWLRDGILVALAAACLAIHFGLGR